MNLSTFFLEADLGQMSYQSVKVTAEIDNDFGGKRFVAKIWTVELMIAGAWVNIKPLLTESAIEEFISDIQYDLNNPGGV